MYLEEYSINEIIEDIEQLSKKYNLSKEKIIKIYILKEIKNLNEILKSYMIYNEN